MISSWTFFRLAGGEVSGRQYHPRSGSNQSGVYVLVGSILSLTVNFSHLVGASVSAKQLKDTVTVCVSLGGNQDPAPELHYCFS